MFINKIRENEFQREDLNLVAKRLNQVIHAVNVLNKAVPPNHETAEIDEFIIGGIDGVITGKTIAVALPFPQSSVVTALVPTITVTPGATIAPITGIVTNFTNPVNYVVTSQNGKVVNDYVVKVTAASVLSALSSVKSSVMSNAQITSFAIGSSVGIISGTNIATTVPAGTVVTALVPTIVTSAGATIAPLNEVAQNFASPVTYKVTGADGTHVDYVATVIVA